MALFRVASLLFFPITIFASFTLSIFFSHSAYAQEIGVSIAPALIEETLDPNVSKEYKIRIKNLNSNDQTFYLSTRNISDVREGGVPVFAKDEEETGMELADWIALPISELTLAPDQEQEIVFTMNVPAEASPGSHFGGVFISVDPPDIEESGAAVGYQVANIISIRVSGDVIEEASIRQFSTDKFLYGKQDVEFSARIDNAGNVLVRPIGLLEVENMFNQKVGEIVFNESQASVFPGRTRDYVLNWQGEGVGFGRYEAVLSASYGDTGAKKTMSSTVSFWVLPLNIIGPALGVLALLLLITFVIVRLYIQRTLAHLTHTGTRIVRRRRKNSSATLLIVVSLLTTTALFLLVLLILFA